MDNYNKRVKRSKRLICCKMCSKVQSPADHAMHVKNDHNLHSKTHCPWCYKSFKMKGKSNNEPHLTRCFTVLEQQFKNFQKLVNGAKFQIPCRRCKGESFTPKRYMLHMKSIHGTWGCHWCGDDSELSLEHEMDCFAKLETVKEIPTDVCEECIVFDSRLERRQMRGRAKIEGVHHSFYGTPEFMNRSKTTPEWFGTTNGHVRFDEESGLGDDVAGYVRKYTTNESFAWKHVIVRANAFGSFYDAMKKTEDVHLLPFSCLCDAGEEKEAAYLHHFHGIAVSRTADAFKKMFATVKFSENKEDKKNCKQPFPLKTVHHLCNTINYVSNPKAACKGLREPDMVMSRKKSDHHYRIQRPFCPHANFYLHMCYEGGTQNYLENRHGNLDVWNKKVLYGKYLLISDLPGELRGCRPPLAYDLEQGGDGPLFLWLPGGDKLYLGTTEERCSKRESFQYGLPFADCILGRRYKLTRHQKRVARELKDAKAIYDKRILDVQVQMANMQTKSVEKDYEIKHLKSEVKHLRSEMVIKDDFRRELDDLRERKDVTIQEKDKEIKRLLTDKLTDVVSLHNENKQLLREIIEQMEDKIELKDKICFVFEQVTAFSIGPYAKRQKTFK